MTCMKGVAVLAALIVLSGCSRSPEETERVGLEFRLAENEPGEGLTEMAMSRSGETFYLHDEVAIGNADIASASATHWNGQPAVEMVFTDPGREKLAEFTLAHVNRRVGMLIDGELVYAPMIRAPILEGRAVIMGEFSEREAKRIAAGLVLPDP